MKNSCEGCYHFRLLPGLGVGCLYSIDTGELRDCPAADCTKYTAWSEAIERGLYRPHSPTAVDNHLRQAKKASSPKDTRAYKKKKEIPESFYSTYRDWESGLLTAAEAAEVCGSSTSVWRKWATQESKNNKR